MLDLEKFYIVYIALNYRQCCLSKVLRKREASRVLSSVLYMTERSET